MAIMEQVSIFWQLFLINFMQDQTHNNLHIDNIQPQC